MEIKNIRQRTGMHLKKTKKPSISEMLNQYNIDVQVAIFHTLNTTPTEAVSGHIKKRGELGNIITTRKTNGKRGR